MGQSQLGLLALISHDSLSTAHWCLLIENTQQLKITVLSVHDSVGQASRIQYDAFPVLQGITGFFHLNVGWSPLFSM